MKSKNQKYRVTLPEKGIEGYNSNQINIDKPHGRGIVIYTKANLEVKEIKKKLQTDGNICLEIELSKLVNIFIVTIYRSPSSTTENNTQLINLLYEKDNNKNQNKIIVGDFNIPNIDWLCKGNETGYAEEFVYCIENCYPHQHVTNPTRARGMDTPSLVDLLFNKDPECIGDIQHASPLGKSDHALLKIKTNIKLHRLCKFRN